MISRFSQLFCKFTGLIGKSIAKNLQIPDLVLNGCLRAITVLAVILALRVEPLEGRDFQPPEFVANVVDSSKVLSTNDILNLNKRIDIARNNSDVAIAIFLFKSLDGRSIEDIAEATFRKWKLGKEGLDNGVLILAAIDDRRARIEVGYGLEGTLTDSLSRRILDGYILPQFKNKEYAVGLARGIDLIEEISGGKTSTFDSTSELPARFRSEENDSSTVPLIILFCLPFFNLVVPFIGGYIGAAIGRARGLKVFQIVGSKKSPGLYALSGSGTGKTKNGHAWILRPFFTLNPGLFFVVFYDFEGMLSKILCILGASILISIFFIAFSRRFLALSTKKGFRRAMAMNRLERMLNRHKSEGLKNVEIFGKLYNFSSHSSRSSSGWSSSSSSSSSSSGGGRSGGGGASSGW